MPIENKKKVFFKNTVMLYILQFSTYLFSFITVPYQTRVLGPDVYSYLGVATSLMVYFQLIMDFGFILSATEEVSQFREDKARLGKIYTSVNILKIGLAALSLGILLVVCNVIPKFQGHMELYLLYFAAYVINAFLPDFLYRGLEQMTAITYRTVVVKALFTLLIFVFLKKPEDYIIVPVLLAVGTLVAVIWANLDVQLHLKIHFARITFSDLKNSAGRSAFFFLSRIASTVFTATNTVLLGASSAVNDTVTGFYSAADKLMTTGKSAISPLSDSAYPYMVKNRDFRLVKKILLIFEPIIIIGSIGIFIFADPLCGLLFGKDFITLSPPDVTYTTGDVLRAMMPIAVVILPSYLLGFPTLGAMGLSKQVNYSTIFGTVLHLINMGVLYGFGLINAVTLAILMSIAETSILIFRIIVILRHRDMFNKS